MIIVKKQDGCVCAHIVANGSKEHQQPGYKKEDGTSPTVVTDSIMITKQYSLFAGSPC
jgi:hypothetical protein